MTTEAGIERCSVCNVEIPEQESYEVHRAHTDPVFQKARQVGWENSFLVDYDNSYRVAADIIVNERAVVIVDAECERVCIASSIEAAEIIKAALDEYWARHDL